MNYSKDILLDKLRSGEDMMGRERLALTFLLAVPAILAQLSMCLMSYIDAAMVGRLGSAQAAAVGLVSTTTWIFGSFCYANSSGFSVQIAHRCGAKDFPGARKILRQAFLVTAIFSSILALLAVSISGALPSWLGGGEDIKAEASHYFFIYGATLPFLQFCVLSEAALIASGNLKVPSIVSVAMCILDVLFNYVLIFVLDMGVVGAALGTGLATLCSGIFLFVYIVRSSKELGHFLSGMPQEGQDRRVIWDNALNISWPLWLQNLISRGAYIAATVLVAPLGTIAIAANSFAIIAEGFCYLPGYGMQDAATTLVGQSLGAKRKDMANSFAWLTIGSGAALMGVLAILMWAFAPQIMMLLSDDPQVISLGAKCLRIEAWAEVLYGASIVANGCCVGAGDTLFPSAINLVSMWAVRIGLAIFLIPAFGLEGYWYAMAIELSFKGIVFLVRIRRKNWMRSRLKS